MGFADLSIADIAKEYQIPVEAVFSLCDRLGISYKNQQTNLPLEDAKVIILEILSSQQDPSSKSFGNSS